MTLPCLAMDDLTGFMTFGVLCIMIGTVIVHVALAIGVLGDAWAMRLEKRYIYFVPPIIWCLATLFLGLLGAACYWLMHRSTLRRE